MEREHRFAFAAIGDERNTCGTTNPTSTRGCPTKTSGGTSPGRNCVFPFEYKGQYFNHCQQYEGQYRCSTTSRYQNQWAYCNERACPLAQGCPTKRSGGTDPGSRCVFPFEYDGEQFNSCQKYLFRYWCSTTSTYKTNGLTATRMSAHLHKVVSVSLLLLSITKMEEFNVNII